MSSGMRAVRLQPVLRHPVEQVRPADRAARVYGWLATTGIAVALAVFIAASLARASWMTPPLIMPSIGPPFEIRGWHLQPGVVTIALWLAALVGGLGVTAGLVAVRRGARPPMRPLLVAAAITVAVLAVLPPAGSTDAMDYAAFGRIAALGGSPYVMTPHDLMRAHDAIARSLPLEWSTYPSPYGPVATGEQYLAAVLGGRSAARIVFWLKLWNALAFGGVAFLADRLLRSDPAARLRAYLLWTINPLLIWELIAAGHLDVLAAAAGMLGLVLACGWPAHRGDTQPRLWPVLAGGALIGLAADIKISFVLFGFGLAVGLRRWPGMLAAAVGAMLAVLLPGYAWYGPAAVRAMLLHGNRTTADNFYQLFSAAQHGFLMKHIAIIATILVVTVAVLAVRGLPGRMTAHPAIFAALALSTAWLFLWQYQLSSYDAMIVCLLILLPASRLDWLVVAHLTAGTVALMPGNPKPRLPGHLLVSLYHYDDVLVVPIVLLGAAVGLVVLCLSADWRAWRPSLHFPRRA
jgi:hypothetical protein